ncbi:MAG: hypothetical protein AAF960_27860 [Bacteroidota bacterium]
MWSVHTENCDAPLETLIRPLDTKVVVPMGLFNTKMRSIDYICINLGLTFLLIRCGAPTTFVTANLPVLILNVN